LKLLYTTDGGSHKIHNQDKKSELERLAAEREGLRLQEVDIMADIKKLEHKLNDTN
jgi:hypothetical protein